MAHYDFHGPRLYVPVDLTAGIEAILPDASAHRLRHVLRLDVGAEVLAFNGRDGEWQSRLVSVSKREVKLEIISQTRKQPSASLLHYAFAPIKHARLDFMVEKAVELGAGRLTPVITQHTQVARVNLDRMQANVIEAAEQCGVLAIPGVESATEFSRWLGGLAPERVIIFCDEDAETSDPLQALQEIPDAPVTLVIGPEGGFAASERDKLLARDRVIRLSLGPRILRADTAAVAALSILQATRGDWR